MSQGNNNIPPPNLPGFNISMNPKLPSNPQVKTTMHLPPGLPSGFPTGLNQPPSGLPPGLPQGVPQGLPPGLPPGIPTGLPQGVPQGLPPGLPPGKPTGLPQGIPQGLPPGIPTGFPQSSPIGLPPGLPQGVPTGFPQAPPVHQQANVNIPLNGNVPSLPNAPNFSGIPNAPNLPNVPNAPNFSGIPNAPNLPKSLLPGPNLSNIPGNPVVPNLPNTNYIPGPPVSTGYQQIPGPGFNNNPNQNTGFNPSNIPPPSSNYPNNFIPQYASSSSSISLSSSNQGTINAANKIVSCTAKTGSILNSHNLHREISKKYGGNIIFQGNKFVVEGANQSIVDQMCDELSNLIKQYTFDDNAHWAYLENDGSYRLYDKGVEELIEDKYRNYYPELTSQNYQNYSLNVEINIGGGSYILEFARIGGVHRQKRKNVGPADDTIRAVKRQGTGEDLNKNFVRNYRWEWKHESGQFRPYEDDAIFLIEQSYIEYTSKKTKSAIVLIQGCNGKTYKLDFSNLSQFNEITNFKRQIQRIQL